MAETKVTPTTDVPVAANVLANAPAALAPSLFKSNINFKSISARDLASQARGGGGGTQVHSISMVNNRNGHRISLSPLLHKDLGNPASVQIAYDDDSIYIGAVVPGQDDRFNFSKTSKTIIYNRALVKFLTREFGLVGHYEKVTSLSFRDVDILTEEYNGKEIKIAKITMRAEEPDSNDE